MIKTWTNSEPGSDKIIAIDDQAIYKGNPKFEHYNQALTAINNNNMPKGFLKIPFSYIREIHWQEGKDYLQVFFGKESEEHLTIKIQAKDRRSSTT